MIDYATDPRFEEIHLGVYFLKDQYITELNKSREVEAQIQNIYSNSGATADYIGKFCDALILKLENDPKNDNLRQTMFAGLNELKYRTMMPVDALCGVRMGAILSFIPGEPEEAVGAWIDKKVAMAMEDAVLFDFFYRWGITNTPSYSNLLNTLTDPTYLNRRKEMLMSLNQRGQE
jgi:hypothetical protein